MIPQVPGNSCVHLGAVCRSCTCLLACTYVTQIETVSEDCTFHLNSSSHTCNPWLSATLPSPLVSAFAHSCWICDNLELECVFNMISRSDISSQPLLGRCPMWRPHGVMLSCQVTRFACCHSQLSRSWKSTPHPSPPALPTSLS